MQLVPKEVLSKLRPAALPRPYCEHWQLTPFVQLDKLVISQLGFLAQRRLARGVKLNHAEACVCSFSDRSIELC
jgi:hypothetical protein